MNVEPLPFSLSKQTLWSFRLVLSNFGFEGVFLRSYYPRVEEKRGPKVQVNFV